MILQNLPDAFLIYINWSLYCSGFRGALMKYILSVLHRSADATSSVRQVGEYERLDEAIAAAKQQVDALLQRLYTNGMTAAQLLERYRGAAETPYMVRDDEETMNAHSFNHFQFAKTRSDEICAGGK